MYETVLPAMARKLLLLGLVLASCSRGDQADLPIITQARSLGAEWALVNEEASKGHLTATYVDVMQSTLREDLATAASSLAHPNSSYGAEILALSEEPADAPPSELRRHVAALKRHEDALESA
jgi:hypothetical protein